jgi:precorrin-2 dehydrogenase/sirohydrochlorin ferrochelatase
MLLEVTDRLIVIIGGGAVAARKAAGIIAAGGKKVRVIAPRLTAKMPVGVEHVAEPYDAKHLAGAGLVFAATNQPQTNAAIVRDARAAGVLVNRADADEFDHGDFTVPAVLRQGCLTVAISAGGTPALAARIRDVINAALDERWLRLCDATQSLRPKIIEKISDNVRRRAALTDLASERAAELIGPDDQQLKAWLGERYPELK